MTTPIAQQLKWEPIIENAEALPAFSAAVVGGMGGSQLGPNMLHYLAPEFPLRTHRMYGLPGTKHDDVVLFIASSYSGNTQETLSFFNKAQAEKLPTAVIASDGTLLEAAKTAGRPYIVLPGGLPQRNALGYSLKSVTALLSLPDVLRRLSESGIWLDAHPIDSAEIKQLAEELAGKTVLVWCASAESPIAYVWKIMLNETAKQPAFWNSMPELMHNELESLPSFTRDMHILLLQPYEPAPELTHALAYAKTAAQKYNIGFTSLRLKAPSKESFAALNTAWAMEVCQTIARLKNIDADNIPIIADFKQSTL